jgi:hypothetical protein
LHCAVALVIGEGEHRHAGDVCGGG